MYRRTPRWGRKKLAIVAAAVAALVALPLTGALGSSSTTSTTAPAPGANPADCPGGTLATHAPIVINTDADWTAANGVTGGSGASGDPYVISCWAITGIDSPSSAGIKIAQAAGDKAFTIRDIQVTGTDASRNTGVELGSPSIATVTQTTISTYSTGIHYSAGQMTFTNNRLSGNTNGVSGTAIAQTLNASGNYGAGNTQTCMYFQASTTGQVTNNTCTNNSGSGFTLTSSADAAHFVASGNISEGNGGAGYIAASHATLRGNTARGNNYGIAANGPGLVVDGNVVEANKSGGIDVTGAAYSTISNNVISNNGGPGITANPANVNGFLGSDDTIVGNHIGGNPYGIVFFGPQPANLVQQTDWTDGAQSITDFADQNTVVDAGSAKRADTSQPVLFSDYVARATLSPGTPPPTVPGVGTGPPPPNPQPGVITGISWNFGDGSAPVSVSDPTQGHGPAPQVSHTYKNPGTYTATLTVTGNSAGMQVTLSDSTPVSIAKPVPPAQLNAVCGQRPGSGSVPDGASWGSLGNGPARSFCTPKSGITAANVSQLVPQWHFPTVASVSASPAEATVNGQKMIFDGDYDGMFYAVNASSGLPVWSACLVDQPPLPAPACDVAFPSNPKNQVDYGAIVASPAVAPVGSKPWVFEAATDHMWALDAATGKVQWSFNAAGHSGYPSYEIEGSPIVVPTKAAPSGQAVLFSIDCNGIFSQGDLCAKPGGVYAVDAASGGLLWFFDPINGVSYGPGITPGFPTGVTSFGPTDDVPYGAPAKAAVAGSESCGGVWASQAVDLKLGLVFGSDADCLQSPMSSPYYEAAFALNLATGAPVWHYQPRIRDDDDMDFGSAPNVYSINTAHGPQDVVGYGSKDGTYTVFDAAKGTLLWSDKLTVGGNFGGFYNTVTDGTRIYLTSALGTASGTTVSAGDETTKGRVWAIDATTGAIDWVQDAGTPTLGQNAVIPGVYFASSLDHAIHAYATDTGSPLAVLPVGGADSSAPAIVGDQLFSGAGTGATWRSAVGTCLDPINAFGECETASAVLTAPAPIPIGEYGQGIWAFCLATDPACQTNRANM